MKLHGSCHCGQVRFELESTSPVPFMRCYCSICRKTAGTGGFAVNLGGDHRTLKVHGREHLTVYRARMPDGSTSTGERNFCRHCGTALWLYDPSWPDLVHPHAGAVDTPLPEPPERVHMMLGSAANWVQPDRRDGDECFDEYPQESLADWHKRHGLGG